MKIIKRNIYEFKELSKDIQEQLIEHQKEEELEFYCENCLENDLSEFTIDLLKKNFRNVNFIGVFYDLSYSQGSGAMCEFDIKYKNGTIQIRHFGIDEHERSFKIIDKNNILSDKQFDKLYDKIVNINIEIANCGYNLIENDNFKNMSLDTLNKFYYYENGETYCLKDDLDNEKIVEM